MIVYIIRDGRMRGLEYVRASPLLERLAVLLTFERSVCGAKELKLFSAGRRRRRFHIFLDRLQKDAASVNGPASDLPSAEGYPSTSQQMRPARKLPTKIIFPFVIEESSIENSYRSISTAIKNHPSSTPPDGVMHQKLGIQTAGNRNPAADRVFFCAPRVSLGFPPNTR